VSLQGDSQRYAILARVSRWSGTSRSCELDFQIEATTATPNPVKDQTQIDAVASSQSFRASPTISSVINTKAISAKAAAAQASLCRRAIKMAGIGPAINVRIDDMGCDPSRWI